MKTLTLSADEKLIDAAQERARAEQTTINEQFRRWLEAYAQPAYGSENAMQVIQDLQRYARTGGHRFLREEMNER